MTTNQGDTTPPNFTIHPCEFIIRAWLEGKKIEWRNSLEAEWHDWESGGVFDVPPFYMSNRTWRVKPKMKTIYFRNYITPTGDIGVARTSSKNETLNISVSLKGLEWIGEWEEIEIEADRHSPNFP